MLLNVINSYIHNALKEGNTKRAESIRLIKAELLKQYKAGKPEDYTEEKELKTLLKLKAQIEDSIGQYTKANREELAEKERFDLSVLSEFLPTEATEEEIVKATNKAIFGLGHEPTMKDMKTVLTKVKEAFPTANGGIVSKTLKEWVETGRKAEEEMTKILKKQIDDEWAPYIEDMKKRPELTYSVPFDWKPIGEKNKKQETHDSPLDKRGEENGVKWHVWYENGWNVEAEKDGVTKSTSWLGYEPRLGVDISDSQKIEEILENYITNFEKTK